jgi:hypothetical protein
MRSRSRDVVYCWSADLWRNLITPAVYLGNVGQRGDAKQCGHSAKWQTLRHAKVDATRGIRSLGR